MDYIACVMVIVLIVTLGWAIRQARINNIESEKREKEFAGRPDLWAVEEAPSDVHGYAVLSEADIPRIRKLIREEIAKSEE